MKKRRIVNYSIKRGMQLRLFFKVLGMGFVAVGITTVFFYFYSNQEVGATYRQFHVNTKNFLELLLPGVIIAFLIGTASATLIAIFFPHGIAGPLYRIERELKDGIGEGNFRVRFTVRKRDELGELADSVNIMVDKLRGKIERIKNASGELSDSLRTNRSNEKLTEIAKTIEDVLKEFRL